jgi:FKBP-type peptidyl-prolyl cis-trans isomerase
VPKDRTTATITIVAVVAIVIMVVALLTAPPNRAVVPPTTAPTTIAQSTAAPDLTAVALATQAVGSDVQTTASGLKYRVITEGTGPKPSATDTVTVNYRGIFLDGTEFDSSYSRNQPATFALNEVISGWTEGVQLMSVGSKYVFTIPPELAYGAGGRPGIPPNSTLVFEIELLSIGGQ